MLEHIQIGHAKGVEASGLEKSGVPLECGESSRGAFAVEAFEELALRVVLLKLRVGARRKEKENCSGEEKFQTSDSDGKVIYRRGEEKS